jgi:hypothetical protein
MNAICRRCWWPGRRRSAAVPDARAKKAYRTTQRRSCEPLADQVADLARATLASRASRTLSRRHPPAAYRHSLVLHKVYIATALSSFNRRKGPLINLHAKPMEPRSLSPPLSLRDHCSTAFARRLAPSKSRARASSTRPAHYAVFVLS